MNDNSNSDKFAYTDDEGKYLVRLARESLKYYLENNKKMKIPSDVPKKLVKNSGIFVTLHKFNEEYIKKHENLELRGCIGRPYPDQSLVSAAIDSAIDSGINDWRFNKVKKAELDNIIFEITALTPPELIEAKSPQERLDAIEIGLHGLILERKNGHGGGLFLPQVPVEWKWDKEEYLRELCGKARMNSNSWKDIENTNLYRFQGEIFSEITPNGEIVRKLL